jgi:hypothetical protein
MKRWTSWLIAGLMSGCASVPSVQPVRQSRTETMAPQEVQTVTLTPPEIESTASAPQVQVERGRPYPVLDGAGRVLGMPDALLLWNRRVNNHRISPKTEQMAVEYLSEYHLPDVLVRVNQYAPLAEWSRLTKNRRIGAGWRYTVGAMDLLMYTFLPGRLIGDDWYNPFTNTINLYSDVPAIAVHEAAYAKDIHRRRYPGTYAVVQHLPVVGMWYRTNATQDALRYIKRRGGTPEELQEADHLLLPMYGRAAGGQLATFIPIPFVGNALDVVGAAVGHVVGRLRGHSDRSKGQDVKSQQDGGNGSETIPPMEVASISWRTDYMAARAEARTKNRLLLLEFCTEECFWCRKLEDTTFREPALVSLIDKDFIPLKIDAARDASLTRTLDIQGLPTLILATPSGEILTVVEGYLDAATLYRHLNRAAETAWQPKP